MIHTRLLFRDDKFLFSFLEREEVDEILQEKKNNEQFTVTSFTVTHQADTQLTSHHATNNHSNISTSIITTIEEEKNKSLLPLCFILAHKPLSYKKKRHHGTVQGGKHESGSTDD